MALVDLWNSSKTELANKHLKQIIAIAGDGKLLDGNDASKELRALFRLVPSEKLSSYGHECLDNSFDSSGLALQDIINEVGRRLGYLVEDGLYRGKKGVSGHDGLWTLKNGRKILIEVKTTDAYAIDLNVILEYRKKLIKENQLVQDDSSILMVVGRKNTGALEAQIRGSRYAWDIRIISVDALLRLMRLKETLDDPNTLSKISEILVPKEYTRVDEIIDLVFTAAEEIAKPDEEDLDDDAGQMNGDLGYKEKPKFTPVSFHDKCALRIESAFSVSLIRETRSLYKDPQGGTRFQIAISKSHKNASYWFAFHPYQKKLLEEAPEAYVALGCGSENKIFLIPLQVIAEHLDKTWTTELEDRMYWHVRIKESNDECYWMLRKGVQNLPLTQFLMQP